ncbi:hypothetical protein [Myxococcus sp. RHSTA-1-4]|uniref:hypothetical protein n=1 Tax=Myxococcus sp. RHSTA-1-4 TaxID=2874601 RepID=UPI001CBF02FE|nr:hypothetical protein [Myxococcus sp. RHSTA-1-4]MBZ4419722.1 hypothetical protein [Myxococcus sp. RHSTA-1-4]
MRRWHVMVAVWLAWALVPAEAGGQAHPAVGFEQHEESLVAWSAPTATLNATVLKSPPAPGDDSVRARLKACLLSGDLNCVVTQWMALKGLENVPEWLSRFQRAFDAGKRQAGQCVEVAKAIHEGLSRLGQRSEFYRVTLVGEHRKILGFDEIVNGVLVKSHQVATNGLHVAVRLQGRIIDAYTGLAGLPEEEYLRRLVPYPGMKILVEVVDSL